MVSGAKGRFGATPTLAYGHQMTELFSPYPGSSQYATEEQRLKSVGHQLTPDWQVADAARRTAHRDHRKEQYAYHTARQEAIVATRQRAVETKHEAKLDSLLRQKNRYVGAVATENAAFLRTQAGSPFLQLS